MLFVLVIINYASSQNGKIIDQKHYVFADSIIARIEKTIPNVKELVNNVDFFKITYLSDRLKVALNDNSIIRFLGEVASWGYVVVGSQYRGNAGGEGKEEFGGSDVNDILNLIPFLANIRQADTSRIGM